MERFNVVVAVAMEDHAGHGQKTSEEVDWPVAVLCTAHHRRCKLMDSKHYGYICRNNLQRRSGVVGHELIAFIACLLHYIRHYINNFKAKRYRPSVSLTGTVHARTPARCLCVCVCVCKCYEMS